MEFSKTILVVGGGLAGMTSSVEASKAVYQVVLVEKEAELGGFQKKVGQIATFPYKALVDNPLNELIKEVTSSPKIKVYTGAKVEKTVGGPGVFEVSIKQNGTTAEDIGAIVLAAGWQPYDPAQLDKNSDSAPPPT
jgi:quinone-modifying oxidoreductase subunit QmoB